MAVWPPGALEFARGERVARLSTCGADGMPHVVPICFVLDEHALHSIVDAKPKRAPTRMKRLRNVAENPRAAVVVDRYDEDWTRLEYVLLRGPAATVAHGEEYERVVALLRDKYEQYRAMSFEPASNPLLRVAVERVNHWRYAS